MSQVEDFNLSQALRAKLREVEDRMLVSPAGQTFVCIPSHKK
jgi:hypothetical protein